MSTVKEKELKRGNQKEKKNLKQLFLWSPSLDTGMAALSQIIIMALAFLGIKVFGNTILNPILFGLTGTLIVCVIFPLYWMVVRRGNSGDIIVVLD
jgi:hypothetical protein